MILMFNTVLLVDMGDSWRLESSSLCLFSNFSLMEEQKETIYRLTVLLKDAVVRSVTIPVNCGVSVENFLQIVLVVLYEYKCSVLVFFFSSEKTIFQADYFNSGIYVKWQQPSRPV